MVVQTIRIVVGPECEVRHGVYSTQINAGLMVEDVRAAYALQWSMPSGARAYVNSRPVDEGYVLRPGDTLQFSRRP